METGGPRAARQANVIVVAVNAAGIPGRVRTDDSRVDPVVWTQVVASRRLSLRALAEPTGGVALLDEVDFADALSRIRAAVPAVNAPATRRRDAGAAHSAKLNRRWAS